MDVQQALPPVSEAFEPLPLAQEPVSPSFEIQAAEVNQEDIWRELEQQKQPAPTGGTKLTHMRKLTPLKNQIADLNIDLRKSEVPSPNKIQPIVEMLEEEPAR